jgi:hypothetical protein
VVYRHKLDPLKDTMEKYDTLEERFLVGVISVPAIFRPRCSSDDSCFGKVIIFFMLSLAVNANINVANPADQELLDQKIRVMLRVLANYKQTHLVLGALGCGAFRNPPLLVASTFKKILAEEEWGGHFREIVFAVLDYPGGLNFAIFNSVFESSEDKVE